MRQICAGRGGGGNVVDVKYKGMRLTSYAVNWRFGYHNMSLKISTLSH
jgi:hypothetical protein